MNAQTPDPDIASPDEEEHAAPEEDRALAEPGPAVSAESVCIVEALLFASAEPVDEASIAARLPEETDVRAVLAELAGHYENRGIILVCVGGKWTFRTSPDVAPRLNLEREAERKLSRAGIETLAIIAYHQPVSRAEIEEIRGVAVNKGTLDVLL